MNRKQQAKRKENAREHEDDQFRGMRHGWHSLLSLEPVQDAGPQLPLRDLGEGKEET